MNTSTNNVFPITTQTDKLEQYLKTVSHGTEIQLSYLNNINKLIGGFERRKMIVVGSRPSECKTTFVLQMAYELSIQFNVLYLSLEMTIEEAMFRLFCYETKMPNSDFFSGRMYDYVPIFNKFKESLIEKNRLF